MVVVWVPCNFFRSQNLKTLKSRCWFLLARLVITSSSTICSLSTLQFHTFSILKSIGTSKKSGLNPCNFTSAKPTVQHSEHLFEFEYHVISSSSKPISQIKRPVIVFENPVISSTFKASKCCGWNFVLDLPYAFRGLVWFCECGLTSALYEHR